MSEYMPIAKDVEALATHVVDAAYCVHKAIGPGLLESVYEVCLAHELTKRNIQFERQVTLPVIYDGVQLDAALRLDLWIERKKSSNSKPLKKYCPFIEHRS